MRARQGAILERNHDVLMSIHNNKKIIIQYNSLKCNCKTGYYADETSDNLFNKLLIKSKSWRHL